MDGYLAVISKREVRDYADRPLSRDQITRILQAGRAAGSSKNRQPWRFTVVTERALLDALSGVVHAPANVRSCTAAVAIDMASAQQGFDGGRAAQNMMVAAWSDGVGSCPNGIADPDRAREILGLDADRHLLTILTFGYPARPRHIEGRDPASILRRVDRRPLEDLVRWL